MTSDQPLRLFVDAHVFDDLPQGTLTFIREIYLVMARQPGIRLYLGAYDTDRLAKFFPPGENVVLINYKSRSGLRRLLFDIPAIIRKNKIDFAHFQYITPVVKNCRWIVTIHDVIFKDFPDEFSWSYRVMKRLLYGISALRADILTTVSDFSKGSIRRFLRTGDRPIHVLHNGVSARFFEPYDKQRSREHIKARYGFDRFLLYVSRIEPRKNHLFLLQAWLQLKLYEQGIHLVFLGHETIPVPSFDRMLAGLPSGVKEFVYIDSGVKDDDLLEMYRAATLFVYPSRAEGFGIPPLEAAALRVPVLCSNSSAMKDFSFFGTNQIDPYDYAAFRQRLQEMLLVPPDAAFLAGVSEIVRREYTWEGSAAILYGLLARSLKNGTLADS
jgi:glycosyltransferase involved in cell wall biosynthesis